jgi:predicted RND superfamily exporter protein
MIGVAFKIITNLLLLPILASFFTFDEGYVARETGARDSREHVIRGLAIIVQPKYAVRTTIFYTLLFGLAVWQSQGRHVGDLHPGAPELRADSNYNTDAVMITEKFSLGLDVLTVIIETPAEACIQYEAMHYHGSERAGRALHRLGARHRQAGECRLD